MIGLVPLLHDEGALVGGTRTDRLVICPRPSGFLNGFMPSPLT